MKKLIILLTFLLTGVCAKANQLKIINNTDCDFIVMTANDLVMHTIPSIWVTGVPVTIF